MPVLAAGGACDQVPPASFFPPVLGSGLSPPALCTKQWAWLNSILPNRAYGFSAKTMELFASEGNPIPADPLVGEITTSDGVSLRFARWRALKSPSLGTVCLIEGRGHNIEQSFETIALLRQRGFVVACFDWRSQGGSERPLHDNRKCHVDSFDEYEEDLSAFMHQVVLPDCQPPYFALAHSLGGLICLRTARSGAAQFSRMVLLSPFLAFGETRTPHGVVCRGSAFMTAVGLGEMNAPGEAMEVLHKVPFEDNRITGDPGRFARIVALAETNPQVSVDGPTYGWLHAACVAVREVAEPGFASGIRVPTLIITGGIDRVVSLTAAENLAANLRAGGLLNIPGGRHHLLMDRDSVREQLWAAFDEFVPGSY
jgi:lysophospholipase